MPSPEAIVFSLCHELGNLLAAMRLHGELLDEDSGRKVAELSARSGSLVSLVRPLLSEAPAKPAAADPRGVLEGLSRGLDDPRDARVRIEPGAADLPRVAVEGELLGHLLLSDLFAAFEDLEPGGQIRLEAVAESGAVVFVVEGGPALAAASADTLCGRHLTLQAARSLLEPRGGSATAASAEGVHRVELRVPVA